MFDFLLSKPKPPQPGDIVRLRSGGLIGPIEYVGDADGDDAFFRAPNEDGEMLTWNDEGYAIEGGPRAHDIMQTSQSTHDLIGDGDILVYGTERWVVNHITWHMKEILSHRIHPLPGKRRYVGCHGSYYEGGALVAPDAIIPAEVMESLTPPKPEPVPERVTLDVQFDSHGGIDHVIEQIAEKHRAKEVPLIAAGMPATADVTYRLTVFLRGRDPGLQYVGLPGTTAGELFAELTCALRTKGCATLNTRQGDLRVIRTDDIISFHLESER